jgi:hypothetical protein
MLTRLLLVSGLGLLLFFIDGSRLAALAQEPVDNQAGLVIVFGPDELEKTCVALPDGQVSGLDILDEAGIDFQSEVGSSVGVGICKIDEVGCDVPAEFCFCQCRGIECAYWNYLRHSADNPASEWEYSSLGAIATDVQPGDVEVWAWGDTGVAVPFIPFAEICTAAAETPVENAALTTEPEATATVGDIVAETVPTNPATAAPSTPLSTPNCVSGIISLTAGLLLGSIVIRKRD